MQPPGHSNGMIANVYVSSNYLAFQRVTTYYVNKPKFVVCILYILIFYTKFTTTTFRKTF